MHGLRAIDSGRSIDRSLTSGDCARHRLGPPEHFTAMPEGIAPARCTVLHRVDAHRDCPRQ